LLEISARIARAPPCKFYFSTTKWDITWNLQFFLGQLRQQIRRDFYQTEGEINIWVF